MPDPQTSSANHMLLTLTADGLVSSVSSETVRILGALTGGCIGTPVTKILADRSAYEIPRILRNARDSGNWEGEMVFRNSEGNELGLRATIFSLLDRSGQLCSFALVAAPAETPASGVARDETSEVSAKLRNVSHELNNRLAVVMGFAQLVMLDKRCQESMRSHMEKAFAEIQRVVEIVEDLHHFAQSLQKT